MARLMVRPGCTESENCKILRFEPKEPTVSVSQITFKIEVRYVPGQTQTEGWRYDLTWGPANAASDFGYTTKGDAKSAAERKAIEIAKEAQYPETYEFTPVI